MSNWLTGRRLEGKKPVIQQKISGTVVQQGELIERISSTVVRRGELIERISGTVVQQGELIERISGTVVQQGELIERISGTVVQQGELIERISGTVVRRGELIERISGAVVQQGELIERISGTVVQQGQLIERISGTVVQQDVINTLTNSTIGCPGECMHTLTSFFCDQVLETTDCGFSYLRCCVPRNFNFGTPVELSPSPQEDSNISFSDDTGQPQLSSSIPTTNGLSENTVLESLTILPPKTDATLSTTKSSTDLKLKPEISEVGVQIKSCPGLCIERAYVLYCRTIAEDAFCTNDRSCCISDASTSSPTTDTTIFSSKPVETSSQSTLPPQPECPGTCVAPLFSLLCDQVAPKFYCPDGGQCCVPPSQTSKTTTTTTEPSISPCPGTCIPTFLRGFCNKRAGQLPDATGCATGTICCFIFQNGDQNIDQELPTFFHRPLQPSTSGNQNLHIPERPSRPHISGIQGPVLPQFSHRPQSKPHPNRFIPIRPVLPRPSEKQQIDEETVGSLVSQEKFSQLAEEINIVSPTDRVSCPGSCITPLFRFTCFGNSDVYLGFSCSKRDQICCSPIAEIQRHQQGLQSSVTSSAAVAPSTRLQIKTRKGYHILVPFIFP
ncbi:uncharacterized protein LOC143241708 [Tachypleus tridentatus]|uniref:uncharacterized protein LOC143241708 n=1 Tax=Tachypleus tridentatus TaxID=6853 RepID=UPI003FD12AFA